MTQLQGDARFPFSEFKETNRKVASALIREFDGPLTRELLLEPGKFGLGKVPTEKKPDATTTMVCGFCSTGCGLNVHLRDGEAVNLSPTTDYPVNLGMACPKGWEALSVLNSPDRATSPRLRNSSESLEDVSWEVAIETFVHRFQQLLRDHGPESVAFLSTGQIPTEEMMLLGCLAKFGMGFVHGDSNTRQCMATAAVAYKQSFGFDAPPYTYQDFEESDVLVFVGANPCVGHPIMWERVLRNRRNPKIVVVDPRRTETAQAASHHFAIRPKSDLALLYGIAHLLIREGWVAEKFIADHTSGYEAFAAHVKDFTPQRVSVETGISEGQLLDFARLIHHEERVSFWWTMGVNQSYQGVRTAQAIINLALLTGNLGRPGTGANSITGQCNAMGSRLFSNTASLIGGHDFANAEHRQKIADLLEMDVDKIPVRDSLCYDQIIDGIRDGKIRGLWIIATNTAHSWIHQNETQKLLKKLDFLVVQDMYGNTETAQLADLLLPAAGWGEKDGTFINSERRIGLLKKVVRAPGQALADFSIFKLIAEAWGCGGMFAKWRKPEDVFQTMKTLSRGRPFDISGIRNYQMIDACGGIQWPWPEAKLDAETDTASGVELAESVFPNQRRLFEDGKFYHADGRAKFLFVEPQAMPEPPSSEFPFVLLTGRGTVSQWHTQSRTSKSAVLRKLYPRDVYVEIHPHDAVRAGIKLHQQVVVESVRGRAIARAFITATVQPGQVFMPMHYAETNRLTLPHYDPYSRQPSYKDCAVRVLPLRVAHS